MSDSANRNSDKINNDIKVSEFVATLLPRNSAVLVAISVSLLLVAMMVMSVAYFSPIAAYAKSKKTDNETSQSENNPQSSESLGKNNAPLTELGQPANTEESNKNLPSESSKKGNAPLTELGGASLLNESGGTKLPPGVKLPPGGVFENPTDNNTGGGTNNTNTTGGGGGGGETNNTNTNGNNNTNTNTNTNNNTNTNTNVNNNTNINQNTIVNQNTIKNSVKVNNQVNNIIKQQTAALSATAAITTSPTSKGPLVDLETISLGKSVFAAGGIRPLADVFPFHVIGGHISLNSVSGNTVNLIVAQITDSGVEHAVVLNLKQTLNVIAGKEILYHTDLGPVISGTNPFTGKPDTVSNISDLILWNNSLNDVIFNDDNAVTMTIIYQ
jgi:hypothetical protein